MQNALDEVARMCNTELEAYTQCVDANPRTWQVECASGKSALTACAAKHSGLVNHIKERCRGEIEQYERCLKANAARPDTCLPQLHRMWDCTEGGRPANAHQCGPDCEHARQQQSSGTTNAP
uniref:IMS import disulfide relay-system CHCH-CHCH-like Cx9C domain-containing protein n=1 Tax=Haptolina brevifila TaxID=156173 RepID=A0A7S2GX23_9EUKA|mmetsp:Transcript_48577/g.96867  ORF Transcript_48577/g.96867 Transcript_48577/m.96867 type:complete len:122 (+) Transcript_48577:131-496(+)|eukprot:CAMPEP_0174742972 /NCGR_PEP_ID=MMETSP1094-20130205/80421_1 /TAXON_ID=156173 /ORGANISM="Chrysochromulina brevifilum, Strain UTEX LB 985" /LENGTH=121 /DNA_ID=CAMNT_0015947109 /DNA_START=30 /DNA_END=395 /DNA_ORIENTATION=-